LNELDHPVIACLNDEWYIFLIFFGQNEILGGMGRKRTRLMMSPAQREELRRLLGTTGDERQKERLRLALWAARGEHTLEDLALKSGRVRATIQNWLAKLRQGGVAGLLSRNTPPGAASPVAAVKIQAELRAGLAAGRWRTAAEVAAWLKETHGIERSRKSLYYWVWKIRRETPGNREPKRG
jgi:transposase